MRTLILWKTVGPHPILTVLKANGGWPSNTSFKPQSTVKTMEEGVILLFWAHFSHIGDHEPIWIVKTTWGGCVALFQRANATIKHVLFCFLSEWLSVSWAIPFVACQHVFLVSEFVEWTGKSDQWQPHPKTSSTYRICFRFLLFFLLPQYFFLSLH